MDVSSHVTRAFSCSTRPTLRTHPAMLWLPHPLHRAFSAPQTAPEYASFEALRIFHTTNFKENGKSEMSAKWCMERGLLKPEFQKKWHKYFEKKKSK